MPAAGRAAPATIMQRVMAAVAPPPAGGAGAPPPARKPRKPKQPVVVLRTHGAGAAGPLVNFHPDQHGVVALSLFPELGRPCGFPTMTHAWAAIAGVRYCVPPLTLSDVDVLLQGSVTKARAVVTTAGFKRWGGREFDAPRFWSEQGGVWAEVIAARAAEQPVFKSELAGLAGSEIKISGGSALLAYAAALSAAAEALGAAAAAAATEPGGPVAASAGAGAASAPFVRVERPPPPSSDHQ